ncbi:MAG TPA: SsrA-binding protein SmpB [Acidimicrobiales bacterium]|nr:SsrA-binding protein SmpB [Acidimicrobiales bacterium]
MAKSSTKKKQMPGTVASNRKARHDYEILETYEAGIQLVGPEVKSLRDAKVQLRDSYARVENGEVWLHGVHIAPYVFAQGFGAVDPDRRRKLLLHRREIEEMDERTSQEHLTLVPLSIYFKEGKAKIEIGLARGRKNYDKRAAIAKREADRELERTVGRRAKGRDD